MKKGEYRISVVVSPRLDRGLPLEDRSNASGSREGTKSTHHTTAHPKKTNQTNL